MPKPPLHPLLKKIDTLLRGTYKEGLPRTHAALLTVRDSMLWELTRNRNAKLEEQRRDTSGRPGRE